MPPQRSDLVLSANIPYGKLNVFVFDGLDIEACSDSISTWLPQECTSRSYGTQRTDSGDGRDNFTELELVQNRSLSCCVKAYHQDSHLSPSPQFIKQLRKCKTHVEGLILTPRTWLCRNFGAEATIWKVLGIYRS